MKNGLALNRLRLWRVVKVAKGFKLTNKDQWERLTSEQKDWEMYYLMAQIDERLQALENKRAVTAAISFSVAAIFGFMGGVFAVFANVFFLKQ